MKTIKVVLKGTGEGLLMHSAHNLDTSKTTKNPTKQYDKDEEAEKVAYRTDKGYLYLPARNLKRCMLGASSWFKIGRISMKQLIAGCVMLEPREIIFTNHKGKKLKNYEIDSRPVVVNRARIMRHRPLLSEWKVEFDLIYNDAVIPTNKVDVLKNILIEGGQRIGLCDHRPQTYGENGTYEVVEFKKVK